MEGIVTITGPTAAGKTEVLHMFENNNRKYKIFPKYTDRPPRPNDDESVICVDVIPSDCDIRYQQYGHTYAFSSQALEDYFKQGYIPVVVINDARTLEDLQKRFGDDVKSYFVHRKKPSLLDIKKISQERNITDPDEIRRRYEQALEIYGMYINQINLFDSIILNTGDLEDTEKIVRQLADESINLQGRLGVNEDAKLYIVGGNAGSGKDLLIREATSVGLEQAPKNTSRRRNSNDGPEMICQGDEGFDLQECDITYENYGDRYGVKTRPIMDGLRKGKSQLAVVSDRGAINELKRVFGKHALSIYVHSDITPEEYLKMIGNNADPEYIRKRMEQFGRAHTTYAGNMGIYDRVFIDAGNDRDLLAQLRNTIDPHNRNIDLLR